MIIAVAVLTLCAIAGQMELRRRYSRGRSCSPRSPLVGIAAVLSRLPGQIQAVLPTMIGLVAGYSVLHLLIKRLRPFRTGGVRARSTRAADPPRSRSDR